MRQNLPISTGLWRFRRKWLSRHWHAQREMPDKKAEETDHIRFAFGVFPPPLAPYLAKARANAAAAPDSDAQG